MNARPKQSGYIALMAVLVLGAAALAISCTLLMTGADSQRTALVEQQAAQAQSLARYCGEEALLQIHDNVAFTTPAAGTTVAAGQGSCAYRVTVNSATTRLIRVSATVDTVVRKIQALATIGSTTVTVGGWNDDFSTYGTIAYVQSSSYTNDTSTTTIPLAFAGPVTGGNAIVAAVTWDWTGSAGTMTCSDNLGNTYTVVNYWNDTVNAQVLSICYATNIIGGNATVTATLSASHPTRRMVVSEYSGIAATSPVDVSAGVGGGTGTTTANAVTSGSVTPTSDGDLIFGATIDTVGTATVTPGTGFMQRNFTNLKDLVVQDQLQATPVAVASTMTFGTAHNYDAAVVAFKAAGN